MPVLTWRTMDELKNVIKNFNERLLTGSEFMLSPKEFILAFIDPEHVPMLKQVQDMVGDVGSTFSYTKLTTAGGIGITTSITFGAGKPPIILPQYIHGGLHKTAPEQVTAKIQAWIDERFNLGRMFGDAWDSIYWLNDNCGNAAAMSVMFPALPTLLKRCSEDPNASSSKRADKIVGAKSFGSLPKLPREVKTRMLECSDLLINVAMLEAPAPAPLKSKYALFQVQTPTGIPDFIYAQLGQSKEASFF